MDFNSSVQSDDSIESFKSRLLAQAPRVTTYGLDYDKAFTPIKTYAT